MSKTLAIRRIHTLEGERSGSLDIAMLPRVATALLCGCDWPGGGEPIKS